MQVYQYKLDTSSTTSEFIVAAANPEEAQRLFDLSKREFRQACTLTDNEHDRKVAMLRPRTLLYRDPAISESLQTLDDDQSILSIRLKRIINEVKTAKQQRLNSATHAHS